MGRATRHDSVLAKSCFCCTADLVNPYRWSTIDICTQEFAELLARKGANAAHRDASGATVLIHAAHARMTKVVAALLAAPVEASGVDKDAASDEGVTALIAAAMKVCMVGDRGCVLELIYHVLQCTYIRAWQSRNKNWSAQNVLESYGMHP